MEAKFQVDEVGDVGVEIQRAGFWRTVGMGVPFSELSMYSTTDDVVLAITASASLLGADGGADLAGRPCGWYDQLRDGVSFLRRVVGAGS